MSRFHTFLALFAGFALSGPGAFAQAPDSFNPDPDPFMSVISGMALQRDGKILLEGGFAKMGGVTRNWIARVNADGSLDTDFDAVVDASVSSMAVQVDGKILLGGDFTTVDAVVRYRIARLNEDGSLEIGFNPTANNSVASMALQADGSILVGGYFTTLGGVARNRIARLNPDGTVDAHFDPDANGEVRCITLQSDGKILLGGNFSTMGGVARHRIARLHADGTLDADFNPAANGVVSSLALQADGKILAGGWFSTMGGVARGPLARLNPDGTLDTGFNAGVTSSVSGIAVLADGQILVGGNFSTVNGVARRGLARLNSDGTLDLGFDPNPGPPDPYGGITCLAPQADGKILVGGRFTTMGGVVRNGVLRLTNDDPAVQSLGVTGTGQIDWMRSGSAPEVTGVTFETWSGNGWVSQGDAVRVAGGWRKTGLTLPASGWVRALGRGSGSSALIEQTARYGEGGFPDIAVREADGTVLESGSASLDFGALDWLASGATKTLTITNEGTLPLTGLAVSLSGDAADFVAGSPGSVSLEPGASTRVTLGFSPQGGGARRATLSIANNDGDESPFQVRLKGRGLHHDPGFSADSNGFVYSMALQPDGKILLGGVFTRVGGVARNHVARLNPDGSLDAGFSPHADNAVYSIALQGDGKILVGGAFTTVAGVARNRIARLNADGSLDTGFNPDASGEISSIELQPDGKILLAGDFAKVGGVTRKWIARLNADGSLDTGFNPNAAGGISCLALQPDGKILLGGWFGAVGGVNRKRIARVNADGSLDTGFNPDSNSEVSSIVLLPDGKILLGGSFSTLGGTTRHHVARLNADGSLDAGFNPDAQNMVVSMALQVDGKILLGGMFGAVGGAARGRIARLNADGSLDLGFNPGADDRVYGTTLQGDGKILLGGWFTTVGGVARASFARLTNDGVAFQTLTVTGTSQIDWMRGGSTAEVTQVTFVTWNGSGWVSQGEAVRVAGGWRKTGLSLPASGWVRARGRTSGGYFNGSSSLIGQTVTYGEGDFSDIAVEDADRNSLAAGNAGVDFTAIVLGNQKTLEFSIHNHGTGILSGLAITKSSDSTGSFTLGSPVATSLAPGASTGFSVTFSPSSIGRAGAMFQIASNDADEAPFDIWVTGMGATVVPPPDDGGVGTIPPTLTMGAGVAQLYFHGVAGANYDIQRSLGDFNEWQTLETVTAGASGIILWTDEDPPFPRAFYRLRRP